MNDKVSVSLVCALLAAVGPGCALPKTVPPTATAAAMSPNIVLFLIDDLGLISTPPYGATTVYDRSGNAAPLSTPNLDAFAQQALKFTHCYATPSCAPSRAQLMTGQYPFRSGILFPAYGTNTFLGCCGRGDQQTNTWANLLKNKGANGYVTGFGGKWNLRWGFTTGDMPWTQSLWDADHALQTAHLKDCGFDNVYSFMGNTIDYYPRFFPTDPFTGNAASPGDYFPTNLNNFAAEYVNICLGKTPPPQGFAGTVGHPFLLHYCFGSIHDFRKQSPPNTHPANDAQRFAARLASVDRMFQNVLDLIDADPAVKTNTLVIVAGDNGTEQRLTDYSSHIKPAFLSGASSIRVKGAKLTSMSWGSRVPLMIRWPALLSAQTNTFNSAPLDFTDLYATLVEAGGASVPASYSQCGQSFYPQLVGAAAWDEFAARRTAIYSQTQTNAIVANADYSLRISQGGSFSVYHINDTNRTNYPFDDGSALCPPAGGWQSALQNTNASALNKNFLILYGYYTNALDSPLGDLNL